MPILNNQSRFDFTLTHMERDFNLRVLHFEGTEALNTPYSFDVELVTDYSDLDPQQFLHKDAYLDFGESEQCGFHGRIHQFRQGKTDRKITHYHLLLVPQLLYLQHRTNQRIFQNLSVPQIIGKILQEHAILSDRYRFELNLDMYKPREYCTQYKESDLQFLRRLCEEEGLAFHFEHTPDSHTLVFSDHQSAFKRLADAIVFLPDNGLNAEASTVKSFDVSSDTTPSRITLRAYDFEAGNQTLEAGFNGFDQAQWKTRQELENFNYPARFDEKRQGDQLSWRELERLQLMANSAKGTSDRPQLLSGRVFQLEGHRNKRWNALWLLLHITHRGRQPQVVEAYSGATVDDPEDGFVQGYTNTFTAIPEEVPYRPALEHPKPQMTFCQTATVCGPMGEEIFCDQHGRVKVRFRWDRSGSADDFCSRWVRVASSSAGNGFGSIAIPRVGMEVVVIAEDGDPDRPLITGCVFNTANTVPYELPANKTRSVFKSRSYPNTAGANEAYFEDKKGSEQIYLHAQRDLNITTRNDSIFEVGGEQHSKTTGNSYRQHLAEEHHTTHGLRKTQLNADDSLSIAGSSHTQAGKAVIIRAGQEAHIQAGAHVVIDGGAQLTLKCGGQHIILTPAGIFGSTPMLLGGAPKAGTPPMIQPPQLPGETAKEAAGRMMALPLSLPEFAWEHEPPPVEVLPDPVVCEECLHLAQNDANVMVSR